MVATCEGRCAPGYHERRNRNLAWRVRTARLGVTRATAHRHTGLRHSPLEGTGGRSYGRCATGRANEPVPASSVRRTTFMDGFYVAFLTGRGGNSVLLFAVKSKTLVGVDAGGMKYDGHLEQASNGGFSFHIEYIVNPGTPLITGVGGVASATPVSLDFNVPANFADGVVVSIQTPFGPINAKISKLRDFTF